MKKIAALILFLICQQSFSQNGPYWLLDGGGTGVDEGLDISMDAAGNTYTTGYFSGAAQFGPNITLVSHGIADIFIAKVDIQGHYIWVQRAGGMGPDKGLSIKTDASGNSYVTGFYQGTAMFGSTTITSAGYSQDIFLAKYNSLGVLQWVKSAGGTHGDIGNAVTIDNFGHVYLTGQFSGIATFGSISLTSMIDPSSGNYSFDVFTAKYNAANGNIIWVRQGTAVHTDRGMDLGCDSAGNIYVTGQFSDTITFGLQHNNNMYNAIFLIKYDTAGAEQWFRIIGGSIRCITYGLTVDGNNNVYITGDFMDKLVFFGTPNVTIINPFPNIIFVAKYDSGGNYLWAKSDGSKSDVTARNIAVDDSSNIYLTGSFRCRMNQWADIYGQGSFNSIGFEDVFALKYNASGTRKWVRQSGGKKNDRGNGIVVNAAHDIIVCGGFNDKIYFPGSTYFTWPNSLYFVLDSFHINYCNNINYYRRYYLISSGVSDIFISKGFDPAQKPYDYYIHPASPGCLQPYIGANIVNNQQVPGEKPDSMVECGAALLVVDSNADLISGPYFNYLWSNGVINDTTYAYSTGIYSLTQSSEDGCFVSIDSVYVTVHPIPPEPTISDSKGINVNTINPDTLFICLPDSVILTAGNLCSTCTGHWSGHGHHIDSVTIRPTRTDWFVYTVTNNFNCVNLDSILVIIDTIVQQPIFIAGLYGPDSITICHGDSIRVIIHDTLVNDPNPGGTATLHGTIWGLSPSSQQVDSSHFMYFYPNTSGTYRVWELHVILSGTICSSYVQYLYDSISIFVKVLPDPPINITLQGDFTICPGDTTQISAITNASMFHWEGPGFIGSTSDDAMTTNIAGDYTLTATSISSAGCISSDIEHFTIEYTHAPPIIMDPWTGLICPDTTVTITCNGAGDYSWYGPQGSIDTNHQSIEVSTPGMYFCVLTDPTGCVLISNPAEVVQYNTAYLIASPSTVICPGEPITIEAITNVGSYVDWHPPLTGHDSVQIITAPGTYTASLTSCGIITEVEIVITGSILTNVITASGPATICPGGSVTLTACSGGAMYVWSNDSVGNSITVNQSGTYTVTVMDIEGCSESAIPINVNVIPFDPPLVYDTSVCYGSSITIHAASADTVKWFSIAEGGVPIFTGTDFITAAITHDTTLFVQAEDTTCSSLRIPIHITVYPGSSPPLLSANSPFCSGDTLRIEPDSITTGNYTWTGPAGYQSSDPEVEIINATQANSGNYTLVLTTNGCPSQEANIQVDIDSVSAPTITSEMVCTDTIDVCTGHSFPVLIKDSIYNNFFPDSVYTHTTAWISHPAMVINGNTHSAVCYPTQSGNYTIYGTHTIILFNSCNKDTVVLKDSILVYVKYSNHYNINLAVIDSILLCPNGTTLITAMSNGEFYQWSGPGIAGPDSIDSVIVNLPGNYSVIASYSDSSGCNGQDTAHIIVSVIQPPVVHYSNGLLCPGDSVMLHCNINGTYNWYGPSGPLTNHQQSIWVDHSGTYYCLATDSLGCSLASDSVEVVQYITPYLTATPNAILCPGENIWIHAFANDSSLLQWQSPLTGDSSCQIITIPGIYTCSITSCGIMTQANVTIMPSPITNIIMALGPLSICPHDSIILYACNGGSDYLWSNNSTASSIVVSQPGIYSVTVTDTTGCEVASLPDTVTFYIVPPPHCHDTTLCFGSSVILQATAQGIIQWYSDSLGGIPLTIGNIFTTPVITDSTTYYLQTTDSMCSSMRVALNVTVSLPSFLHTIASNSPLCEGETLHINPDAVTPGLYTWTGPNGFFSTQAEVQITNVTVLNSGTYHMVDSSGICSVQHDSIIVNVYANPHASFEFHMEPICEGVKGDFSSSSQSATSIGWYFSNGFSGSETDFTYMFNYSDTVNVLLIAHNYSCVDSLEVVPVLAYPEMVLLPPPNVFTPNNDNFNDCFQLKTYPIFQDCYTMEIYNRWGKKVFVKNSSYRCWNGKNQIDGKECPEGEYFYIITIGKKSYQGSVMLLR